MKATYVPPQITTPEPHAVAPAYFDELLRLTNGTPSHKAVAVLLGQYALETGNGKSCYNWNLGNIKAGTEYDGLYTCIRLNERLKQADGSYAYVWFSPEGEERPKGNVIKSYDVPPGHPQTRMRAHETLADGVRAKLEFLSKPHWRPALEVALTGDAAAYVTKVRALGYFTAELGPYQRAVVSLAAKWLPVVQGATSAPQPVEEDAQTCNDMAECMRVELPDWLRARVNVHVALGPSLDDYWAERKLPHDSDPTMPGVQLPDTEPPKGVG
jgi:hypothetical protein